MQPAHLHFYVPFPLCGETADVLTECPYKNDAGIYLWCVEQLNGRYRIAYIGETTASFYRRMKEHIIQSLGGNYRICDVDQMRRGTQEILWDGLWRRGTRDRTPEFFRKYEDFAPLVKRHLISQAVFVAPVKSDVRLQRRIEGALARHLRSLAEKSSLLPDDIRFVVRRADEAPVIMTFSADSDVEGLPQQLEV